MNRCRMFILNFLNLFKLGLFVLTNLKKLRSKSEDIYTLKKFKRIKQIFLKN